MGAIMSGVEATGARENFTWGGGGLGAPPKFRDGGLRKGAARATSFFPQCTYLKLLAANCSWGGDVLERLTTTGGASGFVMGYA